MDQAQLKRVICHMRNFQKHTDVKGQCVTNAQFLFDIIKGNRIGSATAQAVIAISRDLEANTIQCMSGHVIIVLVVNDTVIRIEPSYEVFCNENTTYFYNIKDFMNSVPPSAKEVFTKKEVFTNFLAFVKLAERINSGELVICDKQFYHDQADYVATKMDFRLLKGEKECNVMASSLKPF